MAWDEAAGALLVAVDGAAREPLFPDGVAPGEAVGAGLFPALSGQDGCRVRWNLGQRPFAHPPPFAFLPCAPEQVLVRACVRACGRACVRAGVRTRTSPCSGACGSDGL